MLAEELREILVARSRLHPNDDFQTEKYWELETGLLTRNIQETIYFLENECTAEEFSWLSEVFDEVVKQTRNKDFVQVLYRVSKKYPEESEKYNIGESIHFAETILE